MNSWIKRVKQECKNTIDQDFGWVDCNISVEELMEIIEALEIAEDRLDIILNSNGEETLRLHNTRPDCRLELIDSMLMKNKETT